MKNTLVNIYTKHAYAHNYIFGIVKKNHGIRRVYACYTTAAALPEIAELDKDRKGNYCIRYKSVSAQIAAENNALKIEYLCSEEYLHQVAENLGYAKKNFGTAFEKILVEKAGQTWTKNDTPFYAGADLEENGIAYQIKFPGATFINEPLAVRLEALQ